ncbi:hypothetical protein HUZ36_18985 [Pseudoalteromonas sp. McH1-7]|nr:hypothetical protein [Pseudoalteromonas sp. McH1-7]NUZ12868.1 hypothetical protein [Pseudoalteromonas sp. McH1-7]
MFNNLVQWLKGGVEKTLFEQECLDLCLSHLPENLKNIAEQQISEYNLFQREADNRSLNLYRASIFNRVIEPSVKLPVKSNDCILVKLVVELSEKERINVVLHATNFRVFCICFNKSVAHLAQNKALNVIGCTSSWKSV